MDKNKLDGHTVEYAANADALRIVDNLVRDEAISAERAAPVTDAIVCHLQALHDMMIDALVNT